MIRPESFELFSPNKLRLSSNKGSTGAVRCVEIPLNNVTMLLPMLDIQFSPLFTQNISIYDITFLREPAVVWG